MLCPWSFGRLWSVCDVVVVPYVDLVVAVTAMRVLLFVLHVCLLSGVCEMCMYFARGGVGGEGVS